ncbi:MAG: hypothetical protein NVSMB22_23650 [Chloroflexota bacterium]
MIPLVRMPFRQSSATAQDSMQMFQGIRIRLTLWYSGVLALALLVFGVTVYFGVRQALLGPLERKLHTDAQALVEAWQTYPSIPREIHLPGVHHDDYQFWYVNGRIFVPPRHGSLLTAAPNFTDVPIAPAALREGTITDTVSSPRGTLERYAVTVRDAHGSVLGVVVVGTEIGRELRALHILLLLLLALGALTLLGAAGGGLFLANRALAPARLAYARQRDFIADASHELRTPLSILRANAEVLLRGRDHLRPDDVALLEDVVSEAGHMSRLADNMLNLARLDAGQARLEQDVVDLGDLAREIAGRAESLAAEKGVTISVDCELHVLVIADRVLLQQAVLILLDNAIKYNRTPGRIAVGVSVVADQARLEVRDSGIGIAAEHLSRLGERFYRVDKARSRAMGGAGLGLPIARSIAARHHGSLDMTSELGKGTTAVLTLPLVRESGV